MTFAILSQSTNTASSSLAQICDNELITVDSDFHCSDTDIFHDY